MFYCLNKLYYRVKKYFVYYAVYNSFYLNIVFILKKKKKVLPLKPG